MLSESKYQKKKLNGNEKSVIFATSSYQEFKMQPSTDYPINTHTLPNGLRIIHTPSPTRVAYAGFAIKAGTRHEPPHLQGMAHFVEHMLFKGTARRRAWHILNRMEHVGGDLNAYTNKEEMVVYAAFLREHFGRAVELLADIVFNSTFPQHEMDKEVEVIIDEIQSYEDSPQELIYDDFEEMLFPGHPLGKNILGSPGQLRTYRTADALDFTARHYRPDNMVLFVKGNLDFRQVVRLAEKYAGSVSPASGRGGREHEEIPLPPYKPAHVTLDKETHQAHVLIGGRAYDAHNGKRTALYLLNNLLGGPGMNSRLNVSLRERRGLVYTVESNLTAYTDTGVWCIYFGCDHEDVDRCRELVLRELKSLCEKPLTAAQLRAAQKQLIGQIGVACDNFENRALDMGKAFLHYGQYEKQESLFARIESLTPSLLQEVANEMFAEESLSTLIYR